MKHIANMVAGVRELLAPSGRNTAAEEVADSVVDELAANSIYPHEVASEIGRTMDSSDPRFFTALTRLNEVTMRPGASLAIMHDRNGRPYQYCNHPDIRMTTGAVDYIFGRE